MKEEIIGFTVIKHDGFYTLDELPGCYAEKRKDIVNAINAYIRSLIKHNEKIPFKFFKKVDPQ